MAISINGFDGNAWTIRDMDASANNVVTTYHKLVFTGSYTTAVGGDTLDLTAIASQVPSGMLPLQITYEMNGGTGSFSATGGYLQFILGSALNNNKVQVFAAGGTEQGSGTYASIKLNVATEAVTLQITWRKLSTN